MQLLGCHSKQESSSKPSSQDNILLQKYDHLSRGEKRQQCSTSGHLLTLLLRRNPPGCSSRQVMLTDATAQNWESFLHNNLPSLTAPAHSQIFILLSHEQSGPPGECCEKLGLPKLYVDNTHSFCHLSHFPVMQEFPPCICTIEHPQQLRIQSCFLGELSHLIHSAFHFWGHFITTAVKFQLLLGFVHVPLYQIPVHLDVSRVVCNLEFGGIEKGS